MRLTNPWRRIILKIRIILVILILTIPTKAGAITANVILWTDHHWQRLNPIRGPYPVAHHRFHSRKNRTTATQPVISAMR